MADLLAPSNAANFLLSESRERGEVLTNLKLQKLLYYAQAWHLALRDEPLFSEDFQAWVHGPVLPSQYARFRDYQWRPIDADLARPDLAEDLRYFMGEIVDAFGAETAVALELMTHRELPWIAARGALPPDAICKNTISKVTMREFYRSLGEN